MSAKTKKEKQTRERKETEIYRKFESYQAWLDEQLIPERTKRNIDFCEGRQWAAATDRTERMPRPVFNVYSYLLDTKLGNILGSPMHVNYISDTTRDISNKFTRISEFVRKEAKEDHYDYLTAKNALLVGTAFKYYYFNEDAIGKKGQYKGGLRIENIDLLDIAFSDPTDDDIQNQKWIIIRNRIDLETAKSICESEEDRELLESDAIDNKVYTDLTELKDSNMIYVYTEMARIDGEVYFKKSTKNIVLHDFKPANPKLVESKYRKKLEQVLKENEDLNEEDVSDDKITDAKISIDHDSNLSKATSQKGYKAYLYPINDLTFKKKHKSIIGIPEFDDIIESQKTINSNHGMATLNNLQMACPKYVAKENALQGQTITNKVGETIIDHTPPGQKGIEILQGVPITQGAYNLAPSTLEILKTIKGASDVITGETNSKDLSGYAIAQLSAQSQKPIALLQKELWRHKEREAEIVRQFIILFYNEQTEYKYPTTALEKERMKLSGKNPTEFNKDTFKGEEFENFEFDVQIEVGAGTQYSEIQSMSQLDNMLQGQFIDFATYVECYPEKAMPFKRQLKEMIQAREASENTQLKQEIVALQEQLQQLSQYTQSLEDQNKEKDRIVKDSQKLVQQLTKEYTDKINYANKLILEKDNSTTKENDK